MTLPVRILNNKHNFRGSLRLFICISIQITCNLKCSWHVHSRQVERCYNLRVSTLAVYPGKRTSEYSRTSHPGICGSMGSRDEHNLENACN